MSPYVLPAVVALLAKVGMFFYAHYSRVHNAQTRVFLLFLFALSVQNLAEINFFVSHSASAADAGFGGWVWYSATIFALAFMLHLALTTGTKFWSGSGDLPVPLLLSVYVPAFLLQGLLWATDLLIVEFEAMSYTVTQVPGPLYSLFRTYAIAYLSVTAGLLAHGCWSASSAMKRLQNQFLLIGFLPIIVLSVAILVLRHFGYRGFNATGTLPLAVTFLLAVAAYATHQHRLFDIEFFLPWSKVRKRKTAFYKRIQTLIGEIAEMQSIGKVVQSLSEVLRCPLVFVSGPKPAVAIAGEALGIARFPKEELHKIDQIVVAAEIAQTMPETYRLMKRHKVAAIVPFHPGSEVAASWMLLGEKFSDHVYSPLDFKVVEDLFARLAEYFLDNQLLLRSQLSESKREMEALRRRLANAWAQLENVRQELKGALAENRALQSRNAELMRSHATIVASSLSKDSHLKTLEDHVSDFEARLIADVLTRCDHNVAQAAEILDVPVLTLYQKIRSHRIIIRRLSKTPAEQEST